MIVAEKLTKRFDDIFAINEVDLTIEEGQVFGLIGTNGAGKSTFLRMLAGIYRQESGSLCVDGEEIFENPKKKEEVFYISDDQFFFLNATPTDMENYYANFYPKFSRDRFSKLLEDFELEPKRKIKTFSKGMKKQLMILLGLSSGVKYLLMDETFDGLDPVMRQTVKSLIAGNLLDEGMTPVIASHNLRELEDICDHVGILHKGGIVLSQELLEIKENIHKIQLVMPEGKSVRDITGLEMLQMESRGRVNTLVVRGTEEEVRAVVEKYDPVFYELIPLSLEEVFISETEVAGYDIRSLLF